MIDGLYQVIENRKDGLYQVIENRICAGFLIENGKLKYCAPYLRRNFLYWLKIAKKIND